MGSSADRGQVLALWPFFIPPVAQLRGSTDLGKGGEEILLACTTAVPFWSAFENYFPSDSFLSLHSISFLAQMYLLGAWSCQRKAKGRCVS